MIQDQNGRFVTVIVVNFFLTETIDICLIFSVED